MARSQYPVESNSPDDQWKPRCVVTTTTTVVFPLEDRGESFVVRDLMDVVQAFTEVFGPGADQLPVDFHNAVDEDGHPVMAFTVQADRDAVKA